MPSPNNPPPPEFFGHAQNASLHDSILSNTSGHLISVKVINQFSEGIPQSLAQLSSNDQEQQPILHGHLAGGKSRNPFAHWHGQGGLYGDDFEVKATDPPFTNSLNELNPLPTPFWGDGPLQHQEENVEFPNAMHSNSWSSTNSSLGTLVGLTSDSESDFPPSETTSSPRSAAVYVKAMLPLRHGYPLPNPRPDSFLAVEKRRVGTITGDVGIISEDGSFDYLFNPLLPTTDPRNPSDLPKEFDEVLPPVAVTSQKSSAFNSKTGLWSRGIHCDIQRETMELSISHSGNTADALLFLPDGASQEGLKNSGKIKEFIIKNSELWMSYAISTGREIGHDSLYFVTGCTKAGDWAIATFNPSTSSETSSLKLGQSTYPKDPRYIWERSPANGTAETGPGPDKELDNVGDVPQNQTLFIKGYKIAFSEKAWTRILAECHGTLDDNTEQSMDGSTSDLNASSSQASGGGQAPSSGGAIYHTLNCNRMTLEAFPADAKLFHPLDTINGFLLEEIPEADIAIAHDDEWCEMMNWYDSIDSELIVRLLRSKCGTSYSEGAAFLSKTLDAPAVGEEIIDPEMPTGGKKLERPPRTVSHSRNQSSYHVDYASEKEEDVDIDPRRARWCTPPPSRPQEVSRPSDGATNGAAFSHSHSPTFCYELVPVLVPTVTKFPSVDWNITYPPSFARMLVKDGEKYPLEMNYKAVVPAVEGLYIKAFKFSPLSLVIERWGPIIVSSRTKESEKSCGVTIGLVLQSIYAYFNTCLTKEEMLQVKSQLQTKLAVIDSRTKRWKGVQQDSGIDDKARDFLMDDATRDPTRADFLRGYFHYAGLQMSSDFHQTKTLLLTFENPDHLRQ